MSTSHQSVGWSKVIDFLEGSEQFTVGLPQCDRNKTQGSGAAAPLDKGSAGGTRCFTVADWIGEIKKVWARDAASILDLARVVSAAKTHLRQQHGQWSRLWKSGQKIPVSKSTADRLAVIGEAMGDLDSVTSLNLPRGWNILYCLARLDRVTLEQLIQQNVVHPELTLREARELVAEFNGGRRVADSKRFNVRLRLGKFARFVRSTLKDWSSEERHWVETRLGELIAQIRHVGFQTTGQRQAEAAGAFPISANIASNGRTPPQPVAAPLQIQPRL